MKNKNIILVITIVLIGLSLVGGTYAYLTLSINATNGNYNTQTTCFNIDYNISNEGSGQDITGTLFPSAGPSGGLSGRVGIKVNASCSTNGLGTLKLHINSSTSSSLMTAASSYCQDRKTLEQISGISTKAACDTAGGRWRGYGDSFCEDSVNLQRLTDYTTENDCTGAGGTWKSGGSPLKYAIYNSNEATGTPLAKGYITSADINTDKTIYTDFIIDSNQAYYYIFIWLDGNLVDNAVNDLPFNGYISAEANQANVKWTYTINLYDDNLTFDNKSWITKGQTIPTNVTQYNTPEAAMAAFKAALDGTDYPFYLRQSIENNVVTDNYIGFTITSTMVQNYSGLAAGTYYLKGGNASTYNDNKATLLSAFGSDRCRSLSADYMCSVGDFYFSASTNGRVDVEHYGTNYYVNCRSMSSISTAICTYEINS